ncbi:MAG: STAS domain-containing protein [Planctomycetia bacterium]
MSQGRRRIEVEENDDVTIVKFIDKRILDEQNIQLIGEQLFELVEVDRRRKLLLNFSNVDYLSSAALGRLITLNKKISDKKLPGGAGTLRLCSIKPSIKEVFQITRLDKVFKICDTQEDALKTF